MDPAADVTAPPAAPVPKPAFSETNGVIDTIGAFYDLQILSLVDEDHGTSVDQELSSYFDDGAFIHCTPSCIRADPIFVALDDLTPPALTLAFVTACQRSTKGVDGVEILADCSLVTAPGSGPASAPVSATSAVTQGSNGGGGGGGGGAGSTSQDRITTTNADGETVIVAPSVTNGGGGGSRDNLFTTINDAGHTVIATGAPEGNQITLTDSGGSTIIILDGSLVSPGSGNGITATDERGSLMVIQGTATSTVVVVSGRETVLVDGTTTQTGWVSGSTMTVSTGGGGSGNAAPTVQNEAGLRQYSISLIASCALGIAIGLFALML
ncbi:hypothetical protein LTR84_011169 [Exophiala bonariae]|uniref:Uncharacterized protein n=1 Tax=Exophiala bonariae TaxID=1690606 RepID=A0AAV9NK02_9EURO|nr:hypothetical protein LTR84_011169 [Exophiala bonariae]